MPYCNQKDVEFWSGDVSEAFAGTIGYDYASSVQKAVDIAAHEIEDFCLVPKDYFLAGGVEVADEILNGVDIASLPGFRDFGRYSGGGAHLKFKTKPVISVTTLAEEVVPGTWTARTEGSSADYIVVYDGVRFVNNTPALKWQNIKVTYKAGYRMTPGKISDVCARLAAAILQRIADAQKRDPVNIPPVNAGVPADAALTKVLLSDEMKAALEPYQNFTVSFSNV